MNENMVKNFLEQLEWFTIVQKRVAVLRLGISKYIFKGKESEKTNFKWFFFHKTSILWVFRLKFLVFLFSRMMKNLKSNDFYKTLPKFFSDLKFLEHSLKKSMLKILANCHIKPLFHLWFLWKSWDFKSFSFKV